MSAPQDMHQVQMADIGEYGTMIKRDAMMMTRHVGEAEAPDGGKYTVMHSVDGSPMIKSGTTGKTFHFRWDHLIRFAIERGVDAIDIEGLTP